jgi:hypothetical protein
MIGWRSGRRAPDSGSGASPPASPQRSRIVHVGTGWHPVGLAQPRPPGAPGATSSLCCRPSLPCLPPGHRVVALGEVDGMSPLTPLPGLTLVPAIPEACRGAGRRAPALVRGTWRPAQHRTPTCQLAISRNHYRTVPVMTEQFTWPAQTLLNGTHEYRTLTVVSGR